MKAEIISDGRVVWVNAPDGSCIARFNNSIDIHRTYEEQEKGKDQCLFCTHTEATRADWDLFVAKMLELYNIKIPQKHMPDRFKEKT